MRTMIFLVVLLAAVPAVAIEPGQAEGTLTINSSTVNLAYCYALGNQRNDATARRHSFGRCEVHDVGNG